MEIAPHTEATVMRASTCVGRHPDAELIWFAKPMMTHSGRAVNPMTSKISPRLLLTEEGVL